MTFKVFSAVAVLSICSLIGAEATLLHGASAKEAALKESERMRNRLQNSVPHILERGAQKFDKIVSTSPTYLSLSLYYQSDCSDDYPFTTVSYGTNLCMPLTDVTGVPAQSMAYVWDDTNNILSEVFYSDSGCTTNVGSSIMYDFGTVASGACVDAMMYTTSSTFSAPTEEGYIMK
jgi:hypothetical protein